MADAQAGIFEEGSAHHLWLEYDVDGKTDVEEIRNALRNATASEDESDIGSETNLVVAFSGQLWRGLAPDRVPDGLRAFEPIEGPSGHRAPATQHELWFWIHGRRHDLNVARGLTIQAAVADVASLALEQRGYLFRDSRDLTGFIDGTANPKEDARRDVALVPEGKPGAAGSFVLAQQWVHNLAAFHALDQTDQERVIGRTKPDSIELTGDAMPSDSHVSRTDLKKDGVGVKIYRRSAPFGGVLEHGLYFLGFAGKLERFDLMLASMFGITGDGLHDRLIEYSRATTGAYFFAPSQPDLDEATSRGRGAAK